MVRQAINYTIDKELLNEKLFSGVYREARWQLEWELGYDPSLDPSYPYNLAKAKQLMNQAGYADGFTMPIYFPSFTSWGKDMVDYLTGTFAQINIKVKPIALSDFGAFMGTVQKFHNDPTMEGIILFNVGWPGNPEPVINLTNGFYSLKDNTLFKDPSLDSIIKTALETPDDAARKVHIQRAYKIINQTLPFIPILLEVHVYAYTDNIRYKSSGGGMNEGPANVADLTMK
jgi:peptide/nickel transport system substrate-binding protein